MKDKYGLIGFPLGHSASQAFFNKKFAEENINAEYLKFQIPDISDFPDIITANPELKGLNVTIPYKEMVINYLDELDEDTRQIGAVNVIKFIWESGKLRLKGYNSDLPGFLNSIKPLLKDHHKKALILGTGGASKAVVQGLKNLGLEYKFVSRGKQQPDTFHYGDLTENIMAEYTVIINASPVGTFPNVDECPDIPYQFIGKTHLLYDLVYNPAETKFMQLASQQGAQVKNGEEMLRIQAIVAWEIWNS